MKTILLSVRKEYLESIFSRDKRFEYRRKIPKEKIDKIIVYEARGQKKVVGELLISETLTGTFAEIWKLSFPYGGISYNDCLSYFKGAKVCHAYVISDAKMYGEPKTLADFGISRPPQNFVWIERDSK